MENVVDISELQLLPQFFLYFNGEKSNF